MTTSALHPRSRAADLLAAYRPGTRFFSSPRGTLLADGVHATVTAPDGSWAAAVDAALAAASAAGLPDPVAVGALGFGPDDPGRLVVPASVVRAGPPDRHGVATAAPGPARGWTVRSRPEPQGYTDGVRKALALIGDGALRKVVLARCLELTAPGPVAVPALLAALVRADPTAYAFAMDVGDGPGRAGRTLVGASPELLVRRSDRHLEANPLAGSLPRSADPEEDARRAARLLASDKDRREHAIVADHVAEVVGRFCTDVERPAEPEVIGTATMWHLSSRITGRLADPDVGALALAQALHPTPAVCGLPIAAARSAIAAVEPVERGYYAGLVGWSDATGDGEWVVTIRSAEVSDATVRMFAGAGIVAGSDPDAELAETRAKFRTMLDALGLGALGLDAPGLDGAG